MLAAVSLLMFLSCKPRNIAEADRMNDLAYAFHYRNLDSVAVYANKSLSLSRHNGYADGEAEALNNIAFSEIKHLQFDSAQVRLDKAISITDNQIEQLVAYVQKMRVDRLMSRNREFYVNREKANACRRRIEEERTTLSQRQQQRRIYAETEYDIVCAEYYKMLGQTNKAREQLGEINQYGEIRQDTVQYLKYRSMLNEQSINEDNSPETVSGRFGELISLLSTARNKNYICLSSVIMLSIGEYLLDPSILSYLHTANSAGMTYINPNDVEDNFLAGWMTESALLNFEQYGDDYNIAVANLQLSVCCHELQEYYGAMDFLDKAVENKRIENVPALMADIHGQYSKTFSAFGDKQQSDFHRNMFLDLRELTRQDRYYESRAEQLDAMSAQLNLMMVLVLAAILLLITLLIVFSYISRKTRNSANIKQIMQSYKEWKEVSDREKTELAERLEELEERLEEIQIKTVKGKEDNLEARAKVQVVNNILPLIDRMRHEVRVLTERSETPQQRQERYDYIIELAEEINNTNAMLTKWIELRQGKLRLHIETFALQPLFDMMEKSRSGFAVKGITLIVNPTSATVKADKALTMFMLNTLADNARKFTPKGGTITVDSSEADNYVEISVTDTGSGLTDEQKSTIFTRRIHSGHGFGLFNCRGIIDKYHKVSKIFSPCLLDVESTYGSGSRFFFRLPKGVARLILAIMTLCATMPVSADTQLKQSQPVAKPDLSQQHFQPDFILQNARRYADSAYYSNIAATYGRTLMFSDSCRKYLNLHCANILKADHAQMLRDDDGSAVPPEIQWFRDSVDTDFSVILDIRNETAVAALALHEWRLYDYNNRIYTQLFQEMSADNTLGSYCQMVEHQQTGKTVAMIIQIGRAHV